MSRLTTRILHTGYQPDENQGAIIPPLHLSTTFAFGNEHEYDYSRSGNPTRQVLEATLARIEGAAHALAYSSGSAVLANIGALLTPGEDILFSSDAYGGTYRYITTVLSQNGSGYHITDFTDLAAVERALADHPIRIVWAETPSNPLLKVADIAALATLAHQHGAILVVDNTFLTPAIQLPLEHGADVVVYSTTKYINGHSDSIGGSLATSNLELYERLKYLQNAIGAILSPFDSWLTLRGLRTLELRIRQHVRNAEAIAELLLRHPAVHKVYYPGLLTGEQGDIVRRQQRSSGGIVSVELADSVDIAAFFAHLRYFPLAESLGGVESLIDHPATMTHASIPASEREKIGLRDSLFRISVGIENTEDLLEDLTDALGAATRVGSAAALIDIH